MDLRFLKPRLFRPRRGLGSLHHVTHDLRHGVYSVAAAAAWRHAINKCEPMKKRIGVADPLLVFTFAFLAFVLLGLVFLSPDFFPATPSRLRANLIRAENPSMMLTDGLGLRKHRRLDLGWCAVFVGDNQRLHDLIADLRHAVRRIWKHHDGRLAVRADGRDGVVVLRE